MASPPHLKVHVSDHHVGDLDEEVDNERNIEIVWAPRCIVVAVWGSVWPVLPEPKVDGAFTFVALLMDGLQQVCPLNLSSDVGNMFDRCRRRERLDSRCQGLCPESTIQAQ